MSDIPTPLATPVVFGVYKGVKADIEDRESIPRTAQKSLEPPRYCGQCCRRTVVQMRSDSGSARCLRHGTVDSAALYLRP